MSNFLPDIIALHKLNKLKNIQTEEVISKKKVSSIIRRQQPTQYIVIKYLPVVVIKYVPPLLKALFVPSDLSTCQHMWWKESISDKKPAQKNISSIVSMDRTIFLKKVFSTKVTVSRGVYLIALLHVSRHILLQVNFQHKEGRLAQTYHFLLDLRTCTCDLFKKRSMESFILS